jgi:uncharacterized protein (DUF2336 family)
VLGFHEYHELSQSVHAEERGRAARIAARAYLEHDGPADEQAALYAAVLSFLDDSSVKVRAALAYELLRAPNAPRPVMFALAQDEPIIAAAVAQFSPVLLDNDLMALIGREDLTICRAIIDRAVVSQNICTRLIGLHERELDLAIISHDRITLMPDTLIELADRWCDDAEMRGILLERKDLPISARYLLVERIVDDLAGMRIVKGSIRAKRLNRLLRDALDRATTTLVRGEPNAEHFEYVSALFASHRLSPRLMIHALVNGRGLFFATAVSALCEINVQRAVETLETGTRRALHALFTRAGFDESLCNLMARLTVIAREYDLSVDVAARHFVVSQLIAVLIDEFEGQIPSEIETVFAYLNEQNVALAREAARGVMASFVSETDDHVCLPDARLRDEQLALTAA